MLLQVKLEKLSGADTDILQDALAGAVFAGVFEGASKGFNLMGDANRRFQICTESE